MSEGEIADALAPDIAASLARRRARARRRSAVVLAGQIIIPAALLGLWEIAARAGWLRNADAFYSQPSAIAVFTVQHFAELMAQGWATLKAVLAGAGLGLALGVACGLALGRLTLLNRTLDPTIGVLAGLPRIALAPIFLLWFGIGLLAKIFLSFSLVFFVVLINVRSAVATVDAELLIVARLMGASPLQSFAKVVLPSIMPMLVSSLRLSVVFSVLGVIASEMITARDGLGIAIIKYGQTLQPAGVFAVLLVLSVLMAAISAAINLLEARISSWRVDHNA